MNGVNERNHATADVMVKKILDDNPTKSLQRAVDEASFAKGFSLLIAVETKSDYTRIVRMSSRFTQRNS